MKTVNVPATVGEYAGFKMAVSFDSFNHKFVMNLKGQLSHNLEIGPDPLGNISRINHALESMPKQLAEAQTKLENVERQLETSKIEVEKPFAQEAELTEKLERLATLNALLNMDEKGDDAIGMDDEPEKESGERETSDQQAEPADHSVMQNDRKPVQPESISEKPENAADVPMPYPGENAGWAPMAGGGSLQVMRVATGMADKPAPEGIAPGKTGSVQDAGSRDAETGGNQRKTERGGHINFKKFLLQKRRKHHKI